MIRRFFGSLMTDEKSSVQIENSSIDSNALKEGPEEDLDDLDWNPRSRYPKAWDEFSETPADPDVFGYREEPQNKEENQVRRFFGTAWQGYPRSDDRIKDDICERMRNQNQFDPSHLEIQVQNGEVILRGNVETYQIKRSIEDLVETVLGVREINNFLKADKG